MFQLFSPFGTFKCVLVLCRFDNSACALAQTLILGSDQSFKSCCVPYGTCIVLTQNRWHLRMQICMTNEIYCGFLSFLILFSFVFCFCVCSFVSKARISICNFNFSAPFGISLSKSIEVTLLNRLCIVSALN